MTTTRNELVAEQGRILDAMAALYVPGDAPTVASQNRAEYDALVSRLAVVADALSVIARAEAYATDNATALSGCYSADLLAAPALHTRDAEGL